MFFFDEQAVLFNVRILGASNYETRRANNTTSVLVAGWQINDPSSGKQDSLLFLPATPSFLSWTLEKLFELTRGPSRALALPRTLRPELQRTKVAALGAEVPGHH